MNSVRRMIAAALVFVLLAMGMMPVSASTDEVVLTDNGCYLEILLIESATRTLGEKVGKKIYSYKNADDELLWSVTLTGKFTYDTASSVCLWADCTVVISDTAWYVIDESAEPMKNMATADVTMGKKILGIKVGEQALELVLTCDKDGNLS